jgi:peptidoglycan hydrolase CwlO-like protein
MSIYAKKALFLFTVFLVLLLLGTRYVLAQESCDSACDSNASDYQTCLTNLTNLCQNKVSQLQGQANTLANQIAQFNAQIKLAVLKINQTQAQIDLLGGRIDQLEISLNDLTKAFSARAVETYKLSRFESNFFFILSATDISDATQRFHYLQKIEEEDRNLLQKLTEAQTTYQGEKQDQETLQFQLKTQQANLNSQKTAKNNLLVATQNSETKYQSILARAQAALASLANYAESVGISLIPHKDLSDDWGKYYNQRDENWGGLLINGQGSGCSGACSVAKVGCLVTSYAMVTSHYGGSLTPGDVALNSGDFFPGTALFNSPGPSANGHGVTDYNDPSIQQLKDALDSGKVVIAGLSINGGPASTHFSDHWVVLRSVDGDSFKINDPEYPGAMNVSLRDHYSSWTIIQAKIYN